MRTNGFVVATAGANVAVWMTASWLLLGGRGRQSEASLEVERLAANDPVSVPQFVAPPQIFEPAVTPLRCEATPEHVCVLGRVDLASLPESVRGSLTLTNLRGRVVMTDESQGDEPPGAAELCDALENAETDSANEPADADGATEPTFAVDREGRFAVLLARGHHRIVIESGEGDDGPAVFAMTALIEVGADAPPSISETLRLEMMLDVEGQLLANRNGQGIRNGTVVFLSPVDPGRALACVDSDVDGRFRVARVPAQTRAVLVEAEDFAALRTTQAGLISAGLTLRLDRKPVLLGTVGVGADGVCRHRAVEVVSNGGEPQRFWMNDECTFMITGLEPSAHVRLRAVPRRHIDLPPANAVELQIPAVGDPSSVCLEPPCDGRPAAVVAWLEHRGWQGDTVDQEVQGDGLCVDSDCVSWGGVEIPNLIILGPLSLEQDSVTVVRESGGAGWSSRTLEVDIHPGINEFVVPRP